MAAIRENEKTVTGRVVNRNTVLFNEKVTVSLKPGQWHPVARTDRLGGRVLNWGQRGLEILHIRSGSRVYIVNDTIEVVHSQQR